MRRPEPRRPRCLAALVLLGCTEGPAGSKSPADGDSSDPACTPVAALASDPALCLTDLQDAVEQATLGDTITILPAGAGPVHLTLHQDLVVEGDGLTLEGDGTGSVVTVLGGAVTLRGLTLAGGTGDTDPGFDEGQATVGGAVNALRAASLTLEQVTVEDSRADWGGGLMAPVDGPLVWRSGTARGNTAAALGGGIWMRQGELQGVDIHDNAADYAGGLAVRASPETATAVALHGVDVRGNHARVKGGGLHVAGGAAVVSDRLTVAENTAQQGAGAHIYQSTAGLSGGELCDNTALVGGGGLLVEEGAPLLTGLQICRNTVTGAGLPDEEGVGGGLWTVDAAARIHDTVLADNTAGWGAGAMLAGSADRAEPALVALESVTVAGNGPAGEQRGAGLAVEAAAVTAAALVVRDNSGAEAGGLLFGAGRATLSATWTDNAPADVVDAAGGRIEAVEPGATLHCDAAGCSASAP